MSASLKSVPNERQARVDLAACYRLADHFGLNEGIDNHLTMLVPGHDDRFLLAPFGMHWSEVKASDFMVVDFNGRILAGRGPVEPTALYIHMPVHRLAPQARCVLHTHMPYATALTMLENPRLEMAVQSALGFHEAIAYDGDYNGLAFDASEGERMARVLGTKSVLMLGNHGVLVVGETVPQRLRTALFPRAGGPGSDARALLDGRRLKLVPERVVRTTAAQFLRAARWAAGTARIFIFDALKRLLDRSNRITRAEPGRLNPAWSWRRRTAA